jgi:hypothetical protein
MGMSQNDDKNNELGEFNEKGVNRREFLKRTAVGAGAVAATMVIGGCGANSTSAVNTQVAAPVGSNSKTAWKFAVMADTQWVSADDGLNPNTSSVGLSNQLNQQFIAQGVKFVVQVGDLADGANAATTEAGYGYATTPAVCEDTRALFAQALYNNGIGYFACRGNHDDSAATAAEFVKVLPQTQSGLMNATPASAFSAVNSNYQDTAKQPVPVQSGATFTIGSNFSAIGSPSTNLAGLSYGFDYNNARFLFIDQFTPLDGKGPDGNAYSINTTAQLQQSWIGNALAGIPAGGHAFVISHKGLILQKAPDVLFGACPADANFAAPANAATGTSAATFVGSPGLNAFIRSMYTNGARMYFCGHDHNHTRSIVKTTDTGAAAHVTHVLCQSVSSKFYTPNEWNTAGNTNIPASTSSDAFFCGGKRQTMLSQELYTVGYYIVTVDGANVSVDYYSAPAYPTYSTPIMNSITATPTLNFSHRETFGYSLAGQQFILGNGASFAAVKDTGPSGTAAAILSGTNDNPNTDMSGRQYYNDVNTGWVAETAGTASDILVLWGMGYSMGSNLTDVYTLSLSYDKTKASSSLVLATPDGNGNWINAVDQNLGGAKTFVSGPWKAGYALGTYGLDTTNGLVWAVINYNGYFAAVAGV